MGESYYLDPTAFLLSLAFGRGLSGGKSLEEPLNGDEVLLEVDSTVNWQPVFLAADTRGNRLKTAMHSTALNPKLREICLRCRLPKRSTMYPFQRIALQEMLRQEGTAGCDAGKSPARRKGGLLLANAHRGQQELEKGNIGLVIIRCYGFEDFSPF
jgi:hypothetical protein